MQQHFCINLNGEYFEFHESGFVGWHSFHFQFQQRKIPPIFVSISIPTMQLSVIRSDELSAINKKKPDSVLNFLTLSFT